MATELMTLKNINVLTEEQLKEIPEDEIKKDELYMIPLNIFDSEGRILFPNGQSLGVDDSGNLVLPDGSIGSNKQIFTSSGTFTTPMATTYTFTMMGGGESGGAGTYSGSTTSTNGYGGYGGRSGRLVTTSMVLSANTTVTCTVGAGGAQTSSTTRTVGGNTVVSAGIIKCVAGGGGTDFDGVYTDNTARTQSVGGGNRTGSVGQKGPDGTLGGTGGIGGTYTGSSCGAGGTGGAGGLAVSGVTSPTASSGGSSGYNYGGAGGTGFGAGGGGGSSDRGSGVGGAGAPGIIIVVW